MESQILLCLLELSPILQPVGEDQTVVRCHGLGQYGFHKTLALHIIAHFTAAP